MIVGIIGAGAWGTALGIVAARGGNDVILWSYDGEFTDFDGVTIPGNIQITQNMADMAQCDAWLVATPAAFFRETLNKTRDFYAAQPIIICTKGTEPDTGMFMSEIVNMVLPNCHNIGVLGGPQFAAEVAHSTPTGATLAGNEMVRGSGREILKNLYLDETDDVIGTQICGAGKNAMALISGYNSVACAGENERALVFTRAWNEIIKTGLACGAGVQTFSGLAGVGDLFLSATSPTSRNFSAGRTIANGAAPTGTVEGISALNGLIKRAAAHKIDTPILCEICKKMAL